jgi:hypothetical protein
MESLLYARASRLAVEAAQLVNLAVLAQHRYLRS